MSAALFLVDQFNDDNGDPLAAGLVYTYDPGTTTPRTAYTDQALSVAHANPVVLDANGRPTSPIWLNGETKVVVKTSAGVQVGPTYDNVNAAVSGLGGWSTKGAGVLTKSAAYSVAAADDGKMIVVTSGSNTIDTASAAATMGDGFRIEIYNQGTGLVPFNPNGSETVNGQTAILIAPGESAIISCDGSNWRAMITRVREANGNVLAAHEGLIVKTASTTTIDVDATAIVLNRSSPTNTERRRVGVLAAVNLTIDSAASGANGLDTGAMSGGASWYHIWVIAQITGETIAGMISLSATAPAMPSGYGWRGYVGAVYWNGSAFVAFAQEGNVVTMLSAAAVVTNDTAATTYTALDLSANVPTTATEAIVDVLVDASGASTQVACAVASEGSSTTPTYGVAVVLAGGASSTALAGRGTFRVPLTTNQQLKYLLSGTSARTTIRCQGWVF